MKSQLFTEQERTQIVKKYQRLLSSCNIFLEKNDVQLIRMALDIAIDAHKNIRRNNREPYILHLISVAQIVVETATIRLFKK